MKTEWTLDTFDELVAKLKALEELQAEYVLEAQRATSLAGREVYRYDLRVTLVPSGEDT